MWWCRCDGEASGTSAREDQQDVGGGRGGVRADVDAVPRTLGDRRVPTRPAARSLLQARRRAVPCRSVQLGLRQPGPLRLDERPLPGRVRRPHHPPPHRRRRGVRRRKVRRAAERRRRGKIARRTSCGEGARRQQRPGDSDDPDHTHHVIVAAVNLFHSAARPANTKRRLCEFLKQLEQCRNERPQSKVSCIFNVYTSDGQNQIMI